MIEIVADGTPRSVQGKGTGVNKWRDHVKQCALTQVDEGGRIEFEDVAVRLLHFCRTWGDLAGDLDNIAKPIIDAIVGVAIFNDNQVKQILMRRTEIETKHITLVDGATEILSRRLDDLVVNDADPGFVYISVEAWDDHASLR